MFKQYHFTPYIYQALADLGFKKPTPIQERVMPFVQKGENVIGKSQTGTGKTHAFLLPLLSRLIPGNEVEIVIIVPTRELARQIHQEINRILAFAPEPVDVRLYVGGSNRPQEIEKMEKSQPRIVIGTIGKIKDLAVTTNLLKIHTAKTVVVDEADMVFEEAESEDFDSVFSRFAADCQYLIFSATIPNHLMVFLNKYLNKFQIIDLTEGKISKPAIKHIFIPTKNKNKDELLLSLLNIFHPYLALIFANTKIKVDEIAEYLAQNDIKVGKLSGDIEARQRKQLIRRIREGYYQYVVATDLASRGIDIPGVSHIINYELPNDIDFYIHRTGRTGRADFTGTAISFYDFEDDLYLDKLAGKGLACVYKNLKNSELLPTKERNWAVKPKQIEEQIESIHKKTPLSKTVKPGYRKKRKLLIEKEIKKMKRAHIDELYRKGQKKDK
jgi:ATP-dependent RNA helicase CshB